MTRARVVLRASAQRDLQVAADQLLADRGAPAADTFVRAVEMALKHISIHPSAGSPRYGQELGIPGLRSWRVAAAHPFLVFYRTTATGIDVGRILHSRRDIAAALQETE